MGQRSDSKAGVSVEQLWTLYCFSAKRQILLNLMDCKPACLNRDLGLKDYMDLMDMEREACLLKDFEKSLKEHWDVVHKFLNGPCCRE